MISINISVNNKALISKYIVEGHANYREYGEDIVCAAVSMLSQTTLLALNEVCKIDEEDLDFTIDDEIGYLEVNLPQNLDKDQAIKAETVLRTFEVGIKSIRETYPKYITLKYREV